MESEPTSSAPDQNESGFATVRQLELLAVVRAKHALLGQCYEGALRALNVDSNPDGLAQAAFSARELIDHLPLAVRDELPRRPADLTVKVRAVVDDWNRAFKLTASLKRDGWRGEIDDHLRRLLERVAEFVEWFETDHPKHRAEQDMILDQFDPGIRTLPKQLRDSRGAQVRELQRYLNRVAHHNFEPTKAGFIARFTEVENVLRDLFLPEPLADRRLMDELLKGGQ